MDRRKPKKSTTETPTGIEIRHSKTASSLRIHFYYRGVECRETLKLEPTKSNIKYAERLRGEILNTIEKGTFSYGDYFPNSSYAKRFGHVSINVTIGDLLKEFLDQAEKSLQPSTVRGYREVSKAHLFPNFEKVFIKDLTPRILREWISDLNLTAKRIRNILTPLRGVLEQAINDDLISNNPLDKIALNRIINKTTAKSDFKVDPFNEEEMNAILKNTDGQIRNLFQFAFFTGLRTSELIALEWGDIDWLKKVACISRAMVCSKMKCPKTSSGNREVLLLPPAIKALEAQKYHTFLEGKRVFHNPRLNLPWQSDSQIRKTAWIYALKKAGVRYRNPYQTRHTFASMMLTAGENMLWVAKQMGHANIEMVIRHYGRWIPDSSAIAGYTPVNNWGKTVNTADSNFAL